MEHVSSDSQSQAWRNRFDERIELVLLLHCQHNCLEIFSDVSLKLLVQLYICHGCVCSIDDLLLHRSFSTDLADQDSKLTENISLVDSASQVDSHHENHFWKLLWTHLIATDDQN